jgi:hypothetical protein
VTLWLIKIRSSLDNRAKRLAYCIQVTEDSRRDYTSQIATLMFLYVCNEKLQNAIYLLSWSCVSIYLLTCNIFRIVKWILIESEWGKFYYKLTHFNWFQIGAGNYALRTTWFFMMPSIATKFQYLNSLLFLSHSLHVSAPTGHLQVGYTSRYF